MSIQKDLNDRLSTVINAIFEQAGRICTAFGQVSDHVF